MKGAVWEWLHFRKSLTETVAQRSIHKGSSKFCQICIPLKLIQTGDCLKLDLASHYPILGINNHVIETTTLFSILSFFPVLWETNQGGRREEGKEVPL